MSTSYSDLINVPSFGKRRESEFETDRGEVTFYCKSCEKVVTPVQLPPKRIGKKMKEYLYKCGECDDGIISIGTRAGISAHYDRKR